jgi:hypothetical protein
VDENTSNVSSGNIWIQRNYGLNCILQNSDAEMNFELNLSLKTGFLQMKSSILKSLGWALPYKKEKFGQRDTKHVRKKM